MPFEARIIYISVTDHAAIPLSVNLSLCMPVYRDYAHVVDAHLCHNTIKTLHDHLQYTHQDLYYSLLLN